MPTDPTPPPPSPASEFPNAQLADLFNRGYSGYYAPVSVNEESFGAYVASNDIDLTHSRVISDDTGPVAFAMLAVRGKRGWIGAMGVSPEARGRGLGADVMRAVIEPARALRLDSVDLEVLSQNEPAIKVYERLGFQDVRMLNVWHRAASGEGTGAPEVSDGALLEPVDVDASLADWAAWQETPVAWQRDLPSLRHVKEHLVAFKILDKDKTVGRILARPRPELLQLVDVALAPGVPHSELTRALEALARSHPGCGMVLVNLDAESRLSAAFPESGFARQWQQREMRLPLQ